ncbi:sugar phosphate isomerase/epimerase [Paenibacillus sp. MWE-103]|uniref:Sugar phosphate isomerase/epimerase n=1 Tax=Paenibacillus artemisiicola TaxID=1172618 RepID=A0ABS3WKH6_9BACL|nr:sugar phosphate isomerase/epimerase [Paenibacillus artemisiicola]MBO7748823.1 sugar phosphate isomerase/epimerase [Paenibacillus artemisiicola]
MGNPKLGLIGIIHEEAKTDFWGAMSKAAEIGYQGIEGVEPHLLAGDAASNVKRFQALGLQAVTVSASRESLREELDRLVANASTVEASHVTVWWGPCESKDQLLRDAELYNRAGARLAAEGVKLCYHNHAHEFRTAYNGVSAMDILVEYTDPKAVFFEMDIAWITMGGADPVQVLHKMAGRVPAIHVKDVTTAEAPDQWTAVGTGIVRIAPSILKAREIGVNWMVVEQDRLRNLTPMETIAASYLNLKEAGLLGG